MSLKDYGHFSEDGKEFVITRPDTPAPWVNYISNGRYTGLVTNAGGGFSYWMDPRDSRITRWRYNGLPWDRPGRYVYLRDQDGDYWSLSWQPTGGKPDFYECHHGMGYTTIVTRNKGIRSEITYFVPQDDDLEIWLVSLTNETMEERRLGIYSYVELCLGHALVDLINQPNDQHFNIASYDQESRTIFATKNYWVTQKGVSVEQPNKGWDKYVYFTTSLPVIGWDCLKDAFIGRWRSESNPEGVERGMLSETDITAGDACAALHSELVLCPGERTEFVVLMGVTDVDRYKERAREVTRKYIEPVQAWEALDRIKDWWDEYLSAVKVQTPDPEMNLMLNTWAKRQAWVTFNMNRNAGYYHGGLLFGVGVRDQSQDLMGPLMSQQTTEVADRIAEVVSHQFRDGSTLHNYFKLTGIGEKTGHSDTPLWLPLAVMTYLKETGDYGFLDRVVPFQDGGSATMLDHAVRATDYVIANLTEHNLPKFGPGDWNDTLDYVGRKGIGESMWVAEFLCYILKEMAELLECLNERGYARVDCEGEKSGCVVKSCGTLASDYKSQYGTIATALNERCWDGAWYIRGTRDDGFLIGSSENMEGQIFMNSQSWAVISGIAPPDRAKECMESAYEMLSTPRGPKILHPSYTKVDPGVGLATRCVPGKKENGAIFNHVAAWAVYAQCVLGNGDRAYEWYRQTMPIVQAHDPDIYKMEPYVYSEYVTSPDHPTFGQASHSWLTGSGVWMLRDGIDWILGVRPTYDGLIVDPCIPREWESYTVERRFRGALYKIRVENPNHIEHGVVSVTVGGKAIKGNVLPVAPTGKTVKVVVTMGAGH